MIYMTNKVKLDYPLCHDLLFKQFSVHVCMYESFKTTIGNLYTELGGLPATLSERTHELIHVETQIQDL